MWNDATLSPHGDPEESSATARLGNPGRELRLISRPRLPAAMATRSNLNVVHGPPGIGKTVLLRQWQEQFRDAGHGVACVDAARIDHTPEAFWREVLRSVDPAMVSVDADAPIAQTEFVQALDRTAGNVFILVDNVRDADDFVAQVGIHDVIAASPRVRTVIAARVVSPDLAGASLIGPESLCFIDDEVRRLFELRRVMMSAPGREKFAGALQGWPGLLDVAASALGSGSQGTPFDAAIQAAIDYLAIVMRSDLNPSPVTPFMQSAVPAACLHYAIDIRDWDLATRVITRSWANLCGWHKSLLFKALYAVPRAEIDKKPDTIVVFRLLTSDHPGDEDDIPLPADQDELLRLLETGHRTEVLVQAYTAVTWYRRGRRFGELGDVCDRALVILDAARRDSNPAGHTELALGYLHVGFSHVLLGEFDKAERELKYATRYASVEDSSPVIATASGLLALACAFVGRVDEASHWLHLEEAQSVTGSLTELIRNNAKTARLLVSMENLDNDATLRDYEDLDDPLGEFETWPFIAHALSEWHRIYGDPHANLDMVRLLRAAHGDIDSAGGITPVLLAVIETEALLALGHLGIAKKTIATVDHAYADHVKGRLLIQDGDAAGALALMDVTRWFNRPSGPSLRVERLLVIFMAQDALRNRKAAAEALRQAIAVSEVAGNFRHYARVPMHLLASYADDVPRAQVVIDIVDRSGARVPDEAEFPSSPLSTREVQVIQSLSLNLTYARVAEHLLVSTSTVKTHVARIHKKLGTRERGELLQVAATRGILG